MTRIAWKNIWRSKRRSAILITAIAVGLWGGLFAIGIFTGMYDTMVGSAIDRQYGHIQIHAKDFLAERTIGITIPAPDSVVSGLKTIPGITGVTSRTVIDGMGSSTTANQGVTIIGIDPAQERGVTAVDQRIVEGSFFAGEGRNAVVIGRRLMDKLKLKLHGKLVLMFQNPDGTIVYGAFRIAGVFDTEAYAFDGVTVFVRQSDLGNLLGSRLVHEIAIRLSSNNDLETTARRIAAQFPALQVDTWKDLAPELKITAESADLTMGIFLGIILFALLFGITDTMLMSVLDRTREFGMLLAVGMKKGRVFRMVVLETLFVSITGSVVGTVLGVVSVSLSDRTGINLSYFSEGLSAYGISSYVYPMLHPVTYPTLGVMVVAVACLAAVYPAVKAVRLKPAVAIASYG
ncbi:MAG TPA: FtsX-like permease family protein [Bacteroidota bacterium]|nr:FtsX-like permease family protein [Bacteroidota bacterium]